MEVGEGMELGVWGQEEVGLGVQVVMKLGVGVGFGVGGVRVRGGGWVGNRDGVRVWMDLSVEVKLGVG